jgi:hypothetical protein
MTEETRVFGSMDGNNIVILNGVEFHTGNQGFEFQQLGFFRIGLHFLELFYTDYFHSRKNDFNGKRERVYQDTFTAQL